MASIELGVLPDEIQFENWAEVSPVVSPGDGTVLSSMHLPHFVKLTVAMQHPLPGVSVGVDAHDSSPLYIPCSAMQQ